MKKSHLHIRNYAILFIALCISINFSLLAQTTKTTKSDGYWSDPNVWTGGAIPDAANKASINHHVIVDIDVNILNLTISSSSSLKFDTVNPITFTVADEININGNFYVDTNKINPLKHTIKAGSNFYGSGSVDFYEQNGDMAELVFIGNSNSELKDLNDLAGTGMNGKFGGLKIEKNITTATVFIKKSISINSGTTVEGNMQVVKGNLVLDTSSVIAGDNINNFRLDSLGKLFITTTDTNSFSFFENYQFHKNSTITFSNPGDYEMTKNWNGFNGLFGNLIISGNGWKKFGQGRKAVTVLGNCTIENGSGFLLDDDFFQITGAFNVHGLFSTTEDSCYLICNSKVDITQNASWRLTENDFFEFRNGLSVSDSALFSSGNGNYYFTTNNQEINISDTIINVLIGDISLVNSKRLSCNTLVGTGVLENTSVFEFTGQTVQCLLNLDSTGNRVIYSNPNAEIAPYKYQLVEIKSSGVASLSGDVLISDSLIKNNDGIINLGDYNLVIDTNAVLFITEPSNNRMIATDGEGGVFIKSLIPDNFITVFPVGTILDGYLYSPVEITGLSYSGSEKFVGVKANHGYHSGMEDTTGLLKYWTLISDFSEQDSLSADITFTYSENEISGNENEYEVRFWTGNKPWLEPENWNVNAALNQFSVNGLKYFLFDWVAGDSTAITSKIDELEFNLNSGIYFNSQDLLITTLTPDVNIYFTTDGSIPDKNSLIYSTALQIDTSTSIKAIGVKEGWQNSDIASVIITFKADSVKFSVEEGEYINSQTIELSSTTAGVQIFYSLDGTDPDNSDLLYDSPVLLDSSVTLKAIAIKDNYISSDVVSKTYYFKVDTIYLSLLSGIYKSFQEIELECATVGAQIRYTLDGTEPGQLSELYSEKILVDEDMVIKAVGFKTGYSESPVSIGEYTILYDTVDVPKFSIEEGTYTSAISVSLYTDTLNTKIYYTIGNTAPDNINGALYKSAIPVNATSKINAIAYKEGLKPSTVVSKTFTINITGIEEKIENKLMIYPNPAVNRIKLIYSNSDYTILLYNINGLLIKDLSENQQEEIDISYLAPGIYFLRIKSGEEDISILKLIKK